MLEERTWNRGWYRDNENGTRGTDRVEREKSLEGDEHASATTTIPANSTRPRFSELNYIVTR